MYQNICGFGKEDGIDSSHLELTSMTTTML
jgi:hypothetical protein